MVTMVLGDEEKSLHPPQGAKTWQIIGTVIVTFAHFSSGYAVGFLSPGIPLLKRQHLPALTEDQEGNLGALMLLAATLVNPLAALMADSRLGRKGTVLLTTIPFLLCYSLNVLFPASLAAHYVSRLAAGVSGGALTVVCPLYVSEISELSLRGTLNSMVVIMFNFGLFVAYLAGVWIQDYVLLSVGGLVCVCAFISVCWLIPESPEFLLRQGRREAALRSLKKLRGAKIDLQEEFKLMEFAAQSESTGGMSTIGKMAKIWRTPALRKALMIPMVLLFCQQCAGIIAVISYTSSIFEMAGSAIDSNVAAAVIGLIQLISTFGTTVAVDRLGRRPLLISSCFVTTLSMATLALYFQCKDSGVDVSSFGLVPLIALVAYISFFSLGIGPVPWVILGEVFTPEVKTLCTTLCSTWVWGLCCVVAKIFPSMVALVGVHWVMWAFSVGCLTALVASMFTPETKGKSPAQIQDMLAPSRSRKG